MKLLIVDVREIITLFIFIPIILLMSKKIILPILGNIIGFVLSRPRSCD